MILGQSIMTTRRVLKSDPEELTNEPPAEESFSQRDQRSMAQVISPHAHSFSHPNWMIKCVRVFSQGQKH